MRFRILGPLEVRDGAGRVLTFSRRKQRLLLAILLLAPRSGVSSEQLVEWLWEDEPPASAVENLYGYVSSLRKLLADDGDPEPRIQSRSGRYLLRFESSELDAAQLEQLVAEGRQAAGDGRHELAAQRFTEALGLWRSTVVLEGLALPEPLRGEATRLEELRAAVVEDAFGSRLALGQHRELVPELEAATREHPLREGLWEQLMIALYRSGRQAEALDAYRRARAELVTELGVEPGPGLRELHARVLSADPALEAPPPVVRVVRPAQLPADLTTFTGRKRELGELTGADATILMISGPGGVGKSALAIHVAHWLAASFPDGQLYVNLHGSTAGATPLEPLEVLGRFLRALGVAGGDVPQQVDEAAARLRSELSGRRMLLVLDNAANADQVRPLLPASRTCQVIVTSRRDLRQLDGAAHLRLDVFAPGEALELLGRLAGTNRLEAESEAAADVAKWCGYLPLAVRIAGSRLAARPAWQVSTLAGRLADAQDRLDVLEHADVGVRASLAISYDDLGRGDEVDRLAANAFALLGVWDGPDLGVPMAARLLDLPEARTEQLLERLVDVALLETHVPGRYRMHDVLRLFSRELAVRSWSEPERQAALERVLRYCTATTWRSLELFRTGDNRLRSKDEAWATGCQPLADLESALAWLDSERANLIAAVNQALRQDVTSAALQLTNALYPYLFRGGHWHAWEQIAAVASASAGRSGMRREQALIHVDLASLYEMRGSYSEAIDHLRRSLGLLEDCDDEHGQALTLINLGIAHSRQGQEDEALRHLRRALEVCQRLGDRSGEGKCLQNLGLVCSRLGRQPEALMYLTQSLSLCQELGDQVGEANSLACLGYVYKEFGSYPAALEYLSQSLRLNEERNDRLGQAVDLNNLGGVYQALGEHVTALGFFERSLGFSREIGHRPEQAEALHFAGMTLAAMGRRAAARSRWAEALVIYEQLDPRAAAEVRALLDAPAG